MYTLERNKHDAVIKVWLPHLTLHIHLGFSGFIVASFSLDSWLAELSLEERRMEASSFPSQVGGKKLSLSSKYRWWTTASVELFRGSLGFGG